MSAPDPLAAFRLDGRTAIVTGAGGGIGAEISRVLAGAGAHVVVADLDGGSAEVVAKDIAAAGGSAQAAPLDVSDKAAFDALVDSVVADRGALDVLCNNAGIMIQNAAVDVSESELDRTFAVNVKGVFFGTQAAARVMTRGGSIVNLASAIIDRPSVGRISYAMSKGAVVQIVRGFALELGERGIRVNGVAPGWVVTGITERHFTDEAGAVDEQVRDELIARKASGSPLNTIGETTDMAYAVLYLASDAAKFFTGQILRPNGGTTYA